MKKAMGIIFSNIYDSSLGQLTGERTVASLPFGGRYRQVDFVLSNFSNSGIFKIGIITKYNYRSLMDHLGSCADWDLNRKNEGVVFLPPFASGNTGIYKGKLEALYSAKQFIDNPDYEYVVVCDSTVLCNLNFRPVIMKHIESGSDVTCLATKCKKASEKKHPLILKAGRGHRATELRINTAAEAGDYEGMGMFVFSREKLVAALEEQNSKGQVHLERDYLQRCFNEGSLKISVYPVDGVVLRNKDVPSFFANNMALLDKKVRDGLFGGEDHIYTKTRDEAPTYYCPDSSVKNCIVADGCVMEGETENSIYFRGVKVEKGAVVKDSIIMQGTKIGKNAQLTCVILDKNVTVREGTVLTGTPEHPLIVGKGETV